MKGAAARLRTTTDNCGGQRTVSCGNCPSPDTCGGGGVDNQCGCTPESDAQLCTRSGRACGALTATDNCGASRSVASCGSCVSPNTCGAAGQCGCSTETNAQFCARLGASCGSVSGTDSCGQPRSVASCGSCGGSNTCGGGGVANQCGCTPRTAAEACALAGKDCGTITVSNGCGGTMQADCGSCSGVQTCGGGGPANVCGCTPESNPAFCTRLGANCGQVAAADNCGSQRTVSCGASCASPKTCGGGGSPNVCGCTGESDAALCAAIGNGVCGTTSRVDSCGVNRTIACGGCTAPYTCGGAGAANRCGLPFDGEWRWVLPTVTGEDLTAVHAIAPDDVWFAGRAGTLLHWDGTAFTLAASGTQEDLTDVFATGAGDVWVTGRAATVLHSAPDGGFEPVGYDGGGDFSSVWGTGPANMYFAKGGRAVLRWDGADWSSTTLGTSGGISVVAGSGPDNVWAGGSRLWAFNGLEWVDRTPVSAGSSGSYILRALAVHSPTDVWASAYYSGSSSYLVHRFDGTAWTNTANGALGTSRNDVRQLWGASGSDMWGTPGYPASANIYHRTSPANLWSAVDAGFAPDDVHGSSANDVWFAGRGGSVARWTGGQAAVSRRSQSIPACNHASVVDMSTAFEACYTSLLTVNPTTGAYSVFGPISALVGSEQLTGLWAASATQVWLTTSGGQILFFDGTQVSVATSYPGSRFNAIWGSGPNDVWAGTASGGLLHWNGTAWAPAGAPTYTTISDIWGSSASDVYAVGAEGGYLHFDGSAWSFVAVTMNPPFYAKTIRASSPTNAWALDGWFGGYALQFNGSTWRRWTVTGVNSLEALWVAGDADVFIDYGGVVYHYNGTGFVARRASAQQAHTLWGSGPRQLLRFTGGGLQRY